MTLRNIATLSLLTIAACQPEPAGAPAADGGATDAPPAGPARKVMVRVLVPRTFTETVEVPATIVAPNDATLSAQTAGTLRMRQDVGASVESGDVVARLDPVVADAALAQAAAQVAAAESARALARETVRRQTPLFERKIISALEFDNLKSRLNQADAQLRQATALRAQARKQLDLTRVVAPFSGRVEAIYVERGEQVSPGMRVLRLIDSATVKVRAGVPERYAPDIRVDAEVTVLLDAYRMPARDGRATFVGRSIDAKARTFPVDVELDNTDGALKPGMSARLRLARARLEEALVLRQTAVLHDGEGPSVVVVVTRDGQDVAERRHITVGGRANGEVLVTGGLSAGDRIVVQGQADVSVGDRVSAKQAP